MIVAKKDLTLDFIAKGGAGNVWRVSKYTLPGFNGPLAYKDTLAGADAATRARLIASMRSSVAFRDRLTPDDRTDLDRYTTWPLALVEDAGEVCGFLMPLLPSDFFVSTRPPNGPPHRLVFALSWLCASDGLVRTNGIDRSAVQDPVVRLALLAQLTYAVGRLHKLGIVYGDLSLSNAALATNPPRVKLLDCDATASLTDPHRLQFHTPAFRPPELPAGSHGLQDDITDVYKLGLCIIRGLQQGKGATQATDPGVLRGVLDAEGIDLLGAAVDSERSRRPGAKQLFEYLERRVLAQASPPTVSAASIDRQRVVRGQEVKVSWTASGERSITIISGNAERTQLADHTKLGGEYSFLPSSSGAIVIEAANRHGIDRLPAGHVDLYDLPPFTVGKVSLPRPEVPRPPGLGFADALASTPASPRIALAAPPHIEVRRPNLRSSPSGGDGRADGPGDVVAEVLASAAQYTRRITHAVGQRDFRDHVATTTSASRSLLDVALATLKQRLERDTAVHPPAKQTPSN